jgi:hypothetical protein
MRKSTKTAILLVLVVSALAAAQNKAQGSKPRPAPEMQRVAKMLVGTCKVDLNYAPGGSMPNGGKGTAHSVIRPGPGSFSLIEDFEGDLPPGSLHALYWWDKAAQAFKGWGCDDFSEEVCGGDNGLGRLEGDEVVWQLKIEKDGKTVPAKIVWTEKDSLSFTATRYIADSTGTLKRDWTFLHTRVK